MCAALGLDPDEGSTSDSERNDIKGKLESVETDASRSPPDGKAPTASDVFLRGRKSRSALGVRRRGRE